MSKRERFLKALKMRVGEAEIPDWQFRRYLFVFFCLAGALFLWTPTSVLVRTFRDFTAFRGSARPDLLAPAETAARAGFPLPGASLLDGARPAAVEEKRPRPVTFRLLAPAAQSVFLGGSFNDFDARKHPMTRRSDGMWESTVTLPPGQYFYKFKVDGRWELDPANPDRASGSRASSVLNLQ